MRTAMDMLKNIIAIAIMSMMFAGLFWYYDTHVEGVKCPWGSDYLVSEKRIYCIYTGRPRL